MVRIFHAQLIVLFVISAIFITCNDSATGPTSNRAPQFHMNWTDTVAVADAAFLIALQANDPDNDRVTYRPVDTPEASSLDSLTGLFRWEPDTSLIGKTDTVSFEVTDRYLSDTLSIHVTIKSALISDIRRTVPTDFPTIQQAIDASNHGDTVIVMPGVYRENISYKSKAVVIASEYIFTNDTNSIAATIICRKSAKETTPVVTISRCPDSLAALALIGFTIKNGYTKFGGGINVSSCSPEIAYCIIDSNTAMGST